MLWGGVVQEEKEGKLFYKLVLQLDLLTQDPQTLFLSSNKPMKFPNSSFGRTFSSECFKNKPFTGNAESFKQHMLYSLQSQKEKPVEKEGLRMEGEGK